MKHCCRRLGSGRKSERSAKGSCVCLLRFLIVPVADRIGQLTRKANSFVMSQRLTGDARPNRKSKRRQHSYRKNHSLCCARRRCRFCRRGIRWCCSVDDSIRASICSKLAGDISKAISYHRGDHFARTPFPLICLVGKCDTRFALGWGLWL